MVIPQTARYWLIEQTSKFWKYMLWHHHNDKFSWVDAVYRRPRQDDRHFADDIFNCISLNWILLKNVPRGLADNTTALFQIMIWRRIGDKPSSESMLVCFAGAYIEPQCLNVFSYLDPQADLWTTFPNLCMWDSFLNDCCCVCYVRLLF